MDKLKDVINDEKYRITAVYEVENEDQFISTLSSIPNIEVIIRE